MGLGSGRMRLVYEATMIVLALAVVWLLTQPYQGWVVAADWAIWAVFAVDYLLRLALSGDRRAFLRRNIPDLIAALPWGVFRAARLARLARLVRAGGVLWRASRHLRGVLATNGLGAVLAVSGALIVGAGLVVQVLEPAIGSLGDATWWALVTTTTVGYGDIAPATAGGRVLAAVLMLVGIGTLGMITGSIATYFLSDDEGSADPEVEHLRGRLAEWQELSPTERQRLAAVLHTLAESSSRTAAADQQLIAERVLANRRP